MDDETKGGPPPQGEGPSEVHEAPPAPVDATVADEAGTVDPSKALIPAEAAGPPPPPPAPPPPPPAKVEDEGDEAEDGRLRMCFMEHLEELRARIIKAFWGPGGAFVLSVRCAGTIV